MSSAGTAVSKCPFLRLTNVATGAKDVDRLHRQQCLKDMCKPEFPSVPKMGGGALDRGTAEEEADRRLLKFTCYDEYLDSMSTDNDLRFMRSLTIVRKIVMLGYRTTGSTLTEEEFKERHARVKKLVSTRRQYKEPINIHLHLGDGSLITELAVREKSNRTKTLSTVVFLRIEREKSWEQSAFVDYSDRLDRHNMKPFFLGQKKLLPSKFDLGFYDWKYLVSFTNPTPNYECLIEPEGLILRHRADGITYCTSPTMKNPGPYTNRVEISDPGYIQIIIFDHVIRTKSM